MYAPSFGIMETSLMSQSHKVTMSHVTCHEVTSHDFLELLNHKFPSPCGNLGFSLYLCRVKPKALHTPH